MHVSITHVARVLFESRLHICLLSSLSAYLTGAIQTGEDEARAGESGSGVGCEIPRVFVAV